MLTQGAIGNLINRYRAVLTKCRLLNVFGSLLVAGMLVLGGGSEVRVANGATPLTSLSAGDSLPIDSGDDYEVTAGPVTANTTNSITVNGGSLAVTNGQLWGNKNSSNGEVWNDGMTFTVNGGEVTLSDTRASTTKAAQTSIWAGQVNITGGTITLGGNGGLGGSNGDLVNIAGYKGMSITGGEITLNPTSELIAGGNGMQITGGTITMNGAPNAQDSALGSAQIRFSGGTSDIIGGDAKIIVPAGEKGTLLTGDGLTMQGGTLEAEGTLALQVKRHGTGGNYHPSSGTFTQTGGTIRVGDSGTLALTDNATEPFTANINDGATMQVTGNGKVTVASQATLNFNPGSLLDVSAESASDPSGVIQADAGGGGTVTAADGAKLRITGAQAGETYRVLDSGLTQNVTADAWTGDNFLTDSSMLNLRSNGDGTFTSEVASAVAAYPGLDEELGRILEQGYANLQIDGSHVDADTPGVRFLSRVTNTRYLPEDQTVTVLESAARMGMNLVPHMTWATHNAASAAVTQRTSLAAPEGSGLLTVPAGVDKTGLALWVMPLYQNWKGDGLDAGHGDLDVNGDLGGVALGMDATVIEALRLGLTFNVGGGHGRSSGDFAGTSDDFTFWGVGAYAGWTPGNFGLTADVNYTALDHELDQNLPAAMNMRKLESDIDSWALSAGLRGEYKITTDVVDVIPHAGARYTRLTTDSYSVKSGDALLKGDKIEQDIWTFPVGVALAKTVTTERGWLVKPSLDLAVIPAAGDMKAKGTVRFTGVDGTAALKTQVLDDVTYMGQLGVDFGKDNLRLGLNYNLQAGEHTTAHGVFGTFRYEF